MDVSPSFNIRFRCDSHVMSVIIAGSVSGFLMALIFVTSSIVALFSIIRSDSNSNLNPSKLSPRVLVTSLIAISYPLWAIMGIFISFIYQICLTHFPGSGLGSPNFTFTVSIVFFVSLLATPLLYLFQRFSFNILVVVFSFISIFGWFLPHFVS